MKTVRVDSRGRVSLGGIIEPDRFYMARSHNGIVTLEPVVILSDKEYSELTKD